MVYILHNPLANNGKAPDSDTVMKSLSFAEEYRTFLLGETDLCDFRDMLTENDKVILCGGDGTLNRFINDTRDMIFPCRIYLYHAGTGNDFMNDVADKVENNAVELSPYLDNLPEVTVNGNTYLFINGIGFGIDGVACEIADDMKAKGAETINYAAITVKQLLLFHLMDTLYMTLCNSPIYRLSSSRCSTVKSRSQRQKIVTENL